jgi:hypothetical protein
MEEELSPPIVAQFLEQGVEVDNDLRRTLFADLATPARMLLD